MKQGNLFFSIADILDYHQPPAFVLENVKHLVRHDKGRTFAIIMETLEGHLGYKVYPKVINADSVVPQSRQRIFLVGFKPGRASKPRQGRHRCRKGDDKEFPVPGTPATHAAAATV